MVDTNLPPEEQAALDEKNARENAEMGGNDYESDEESADEEPEYPGYKEMFQPETAQNYLGKSWVKFSALFGIYYLL